MKAFENIMGKGENAGYPKPIYQHFLLYPPCFPPIQERITVLSNIYFANAFNFNQLKNLSFVKELIN